MGLRDIFDDAHRRVCIAHQRNEFDRAKIWTGCGFPSYLKIGVEQGFLTPVYGEKPKVSGWYTFTEKGWAQYDQIFKNAPNYFSPEYEGFHISYEALTKTPEHEENEKIVMPHI
jgi:hypothetical protein